MTEIASRAVQLARWVRLWFLARVRSRPIYTLELFVATAVFSCVLTQAAFWRGSRFLVMELLDTIANALWFATIEGKPTILLIGLAVLRLFLLAAPTFVLAVVLPERRFWIPLWLPVLAASVPFSCAIGSASSDWLIIGLFSAAGLGLVRFRYFRWAVVLPVAAMFIVNPRSDDRHGVSLAERCTKNDGFRPSNVTPEMFAPTYYGVMDALGPDSILLAGLGATDNATVAGVQTNSPSRPGSFWVRRTPGAMRIEPADARLSGQLWSGCRIDSEMFAIRPNSVLAISRDYGRGAGHVRVIPAPMNSMDEGTVACDPLSRTVYFSALWDPYVQELTLTDGRVKRHEQPFTRADRGGFLVFRVSDRRIILIDKHDLIVYTPERAEVIQQIPAAILSVGLDICSSDDAVAVADLTGRVRIFHVDEQGFYHLQWGISVFSPRLVKFSPTCDYLAVTSMNERHVYLINRATRSVERTFSLGPYTRGLAFLSARELAVSDSCTLTVLPF